MSERFSPRQTALGTSTTIFSTSSGLTSKLRRSGNGGAGAVTGEPLPYDEAPN